MITSKEIAKICGVSQGTVDRALHNRAGISPKTKELVLKEAERHGFQPNIIASELVSGSSSLIGAIVPRINSVFYINMIEAIQDELKKLSLRIHIVSATDEEEELNLVKEFAGRRCKAIIMTSLKIAPEKLEVFAKNTTLISLVNKSPLESIYSLVPNELVTGEIATKHLIDIGHSRILYGSLENDTYSAVGRFNGYKKAMINAGLKTDKYDVYKNMENLHTYMQENKFTALFCHNDQMAMYAIRHLRKNNLRVPEDIAVIGVDGQKNFRDLSPGISTMIYPVDAIAKAIAQILQNANAKPIIPDCKLLIDKSTVKR